MDRLRFELPKIEEGEKYLISLSLNARKKVEQAKKKPLKGRSFGLGGAALAQLVWPISKNLEATEELENSAYKTWAISHKLEPLADRLKGKLDKEAFERHSWLKTWTKKFANMLGQKTAGSQSMMGKLIEAFMAWKLGKMALGGIGMGARLAGKGAKGLLAAGRSGLGMAAKVGLRTPHLAVLGAAGYGLYDGWDKEGAGGMLQRGASGAAMGAVIGSVIPVVGTAIGAAVGGALGAFGPMLVEWVSAGWSKISQGLAPVFAIMGKGLSAIGSLLGAFHTWTTPDWDASKGDVIGQLKNVLKLVIKTVFLPVSVLAGVLNLSGLNAQEDSTSIIQQTNSGYSAAAASTRMGDNVRGWMDSNKVGSVSAMYESGKNAKAIAPDTGNTFSYGTHQINTGGTMAKFIRYLEIHDPQSAQALKDAGGQSAANRKDPRFVNTWNRLVDERGLADKQKGFIKTTHYDPVVSNIKRDFGVDLERSRALQEMTYSVGVQHGGDTPIRRVLSRPGAANMTDEQLIAAVYEERKKRGYWTKSGGREYQGLVRRFNEEEQMVQKISKEESGVSYAIPQKEGVSRQTLSSRQPEVVVNKQPTTPKKKHVDSQIVADNSLTSIPTISQDINMTLVLGGFAG